MASFSRCSKLLIVVILGVACVSAEKVRNPSKRAGAGPLFRIARKHKWGFMDRTGRVVVTPAFADEHDFFHGLAAVELSDGEWGFIDESGKLSIPARFDEVRDFIDDLAPVRIGSVGREALMDAGSDQEQATEAVAIGLGEPSIAPAIARPVG